MRHRPAAEEEPAPAREDLASGAWVNAGGVTVAELVPGKRFNVEALYWDKAIEAAVELVGLALKAGQTEVTFRVTGSQVLRTSNFSSGSRQMTIEYFAHTFATKDAATVLRATT